MNTKRYTDEFKIEAATLGKMGIGAEAIAKNPSKAKQLAELTRLKQNLQESPLFARQVFAYPSTSRSLNLELLLLAVFVPPLLRLGGGRVMRLIVAGFRGSSMPGST